MKRFVATVILAFALTGLTRAETLTNAESIVAFATGKLTAYKSWSADYAQTMSAMGTTLHITGEMLNKQPKRMRMEMSMPMMGQNMTMTMIMGADGIMWQDMIMAGRRQVMKMDMSKVGPAIAAKMGMGGDPTQAMDPAKQWATMQKMYDLTVLPAAEFDGQPMHVIEGMPLPGAMTNQQMAAAAQFIGKIQFYVGQQDGFTHKIQMFDKSGSNVVMSQEFNNLKFNEDIPDDTFIFTPPPDVNVVDITEMATKMQGNQAAPPPPAPPATN